MKHDDIEEMAGLLSLLPPVPRGWVEAAQELPRARAGLDALAAAAEASAEARARILDDLERALTESNLRPTPRLLAEARRRLGSG